MTTVDRLRAVVRTNPYDWQARLILADALEDSGDYIGAAGQRWQAENKRRPLMLVDGYCAWWRTPLQRHPSYDDLDGYIFDCLSGRVRSSQNHRVWEQLEAAESALAHALHALGITAGVSAS